MTVEELKKKLAEKSEYEVKVRNELVYIIAQKKMLEELIAEAEKKV